MSLSFAPARNAAPAWHSQEPSRNGHQHSAVDSPGAGCAWSFCNGHDRELPLSPDEGINLINLRDVNFKYGSQEIDSDPEVEEGCQPCESAEGSAAKALAVGNTVMGLVAAAAVVTVNALACPHLSNDQPDASPCTYLAMLSLPAAAGAFALSAMGVKQLLAAYKERSNAHDDPSA